MMYSNLVIASQQPIKPLMHHANDFPLFRLNKQRLDFSFIGSNQVSESALTPSRHILGQHEHVLGHVHIPRLQNRRFPCPVSYLGILDGRRRTKSAFCKTRLLFETADLGIFSESLRVDFRKSHRVGLCPRQNGNENERMHTVLPSK